MENRGDCGYAWATRGRVGTCIRVRQGLSVGRLSGWVTGGLVNQETLCSAVPQTVVGHRVSVGLNKGSLVLTALL